MARPKMWTVDFRPDRPAEITCLDGMEDEGLIGSQDGSVADNGDVPGNGGNATNKSDVAPVGWLLTVVAVAVLQLWPYLYISEGCASELKLLAFDIAICIEIRKESFNTKTFILT
eukprot:scaffold353_cov185-Amphora_coffeaeformis.AAC.8